MGDESTEKVDAASKEDIAPSKDEAPSPDEAAAAEVKEIGQFGDPDYARTLTPAETAAQAAADAARREPLRAAALTARAAWFDWQEAA